MARSGPFWRQHSGAARVVYLAHVGSGQQVCRQAPGRGSLHGETRV